MRIPARVTLFLLLLRPLCAQPATFPPNGAATWAIKYSEVDALVLWFGRGFQPDATGGVGAAFLLADSASFTWTLEGERLRLTFAAHEHAIVPGSPVVLATLDAQQRLRLLPVEALSRVDPTTLSQIVLELTPLRGPFDARAIVGARSAESEVGAMFAPPPPKPIGANVPPVVSEVAARIALHTGYQRNAAIPVLFAVPGLPPDLIATVGRRLLPTLTNLLGANVSLAEVIAGHPALPQPMLLQFFDTPRSPRIWRRASEHPRAPAEWRQLYRERVLASPHFDQTVAAGDHGTPPDLLRELATQGIWAVLRNPHTPGLGLAALARRPEFAADTQVHYFLARHPNTPDEVLTTIAEMALVHHTKPGALEPLGEHPRLPPTTKRQLAHAHLDYVLHYDVAYPGNAFANPHLDVARLRELADFPLPLVRWHLVKNPVLPLADLERLADDPADAVAFAARAAWRARDPNADLLMQRRGLRSLSDAAGKILPVDINKATYFIGLLRVNDMDGMRAAWRRLSDPSKVLVGRALTPPPDVELPEGLIQFAPDMGMAGGELLTRVLQQPTADSILLDRFVVRGLIRHVDLPAVYSAAIALGRDQFVQLLLDRNLPFEGPSASGSVALVAAALQNNGPLVERLLARGASREAREAHLTAAEHAARILAADALRPLAATAEHIELLRAFDAWAQRAPIDSPFVGQWITPFDFRNARGPDSGQSTLILRADGSFIFDNRDYHLRGAWRLDGARAIGRPVHLPGESTPARPLPAEFRADLSPDSKQLVVSLDGATLVMVGPVKPRTAR